MNYFDSTLICGFYGNHNLGDEAMLSGILKLLEKKEKPNIVVFSNDPVDTFRRHGVDSIHISSRKYFGSRLLENFRCRSFILGGGDLLRDSPQSSVALNWLKYLKTALVLKRYTAILGVSVGEIWREETKEAIPKVLNQVQLIAVRDENSRNRLEELGVKQKIHVVGDLALHAVSSRPVKTNLSKERPIQIGLSVRHLVGRGKSVNPEIYEHVLRELVKAADLLVDNFQATIHFLPLRTSRDSYHVIDDDYVASLQALRFSRYNSQAIVDRYFDSAQDFAEKAYELDLVIGMRLHSLILSCAVGTPIVGIAYDTKVSSFMEEVKQEDNCIPLDEVTAETVFDVSAKVIQTIQEGQAKLVESVRLYQNKISILESYLPNM